MGKLATGQPCFPRSSSKRTQDSILVLEGLLFRYENENDDILDDDGDDGEDDDGDDDDDVMLITGDFSAYWMEIKLKFG